MAAPNRNYKLQKLKKSQVFIEFSFFWLHYLKFFERMKSFFFYLKCPFCRPLDYAAVGDRTTRLP
jgi:hypothetical protein